MMVDGQVWLVMPTSGQRPSVPILPPMNGRGTGVEIHTLEKKQPRFLRV